MAMAAVVVHFQEVEENFGWSWNVVVQTLEDLEDSYCAYGLICCRGLTEQDWMSLEEVAELCLR